MIERAQLELAGDYVLGLLDPTERRQFEAAMAADAELAAHVQALEARFAALDRTARPEPVPEGLWARIAAEVDGSGARVRPPARRLPAWLAVAASLVVAVGIGFAAGRFSAPVQSRPVVVAVLMTDGAAPGAIIEAFADNRVHVVPLEDFVVPEGKVLEVWTKWDETVGPVSLGQLSRAMDAVLDGPAQPVPAGGQLYEITLEDAPRSPTGKPTGPILVKGFAAAPPA
jgi:anti-sigma-K factor RskA